MGRTTCHLALPSLLLAIAAACHSAPAAAPASVIQMSPEPVTTQLIGEGRLSAAPEYIELTVTVRSECFDTPMAASAATDEAVAKVMTLLASATNTSSDKDGVFSSGGFTQPFVRYIGDNRRVCQGTFQKTATVVMKSTRVGDFPREFVRIQRDILTGALRQPSSQRASGVTFATLEAPIPRLTYKTREQLEQRALAAALDNARAKFSETTRAACGKASHHIVRFLERSADTGRVIPYERSQPRSGGATIELDAIWINKLLEVHFAFDSKTCAG